MRDIKVGNIIVPGDSNVVELRKQLSRMMDVRGKFEEYRREGFDSETAADLSGLDQLPPEERTAAVLSTAYYDGPTDRIRQAATYETQSALRNVGQATGAAAGSALSMVVLKTATRHASVLTLTGVAVAGAAVSVVAGKLVSSSLGTVAAVITVLNIACATSLVGLALMRRK